MSTCLFQGWGFRKYHYVQPCYNPQINLLTILWGDLRCKERSWKKERVDLNEDLITWNAVCQRTVIRELFLQALA